MPQLDSDLAVGGQLRKIPAKAGQGYCVIPTHGSSQVLSSFAYVIRYYDWLQRMEPAQFEKTQRISLLINYCYSNTVMVY